MRAESVHQKIHSEVVTLVPKSSRRRDLRCCNASSTDADTFPSAAGETTFATGAVATAVIILNTIEWHCDSCQNAGFSGERLATT